MRGWANGIVDKRAHGRTKVRLDDKRADKRTPGQTDMRADANIFRVVSHPLGRRGTAAVEKVFLRTEQ